MSVINAVPLLAAAGGDYQISRSVRLRSSASAYFNRTFGSPTSGNIFTWSGWVKRGAIGSVQPLFTPSLAAGEGAVFNASNQISIAVNGALLLVSTAVYRDPSAWYHIVLVSDMGNATASLRFRVYVNGVEVTAWSTDARASYTSFPYWNKNTVVHYMGYSNAYPAYADGYMTEVNFIDGQALTPSSFGETDAITGVWKPKKYTGTYGTNGFYLNFSDNSNNTAATIGKDYSGNGNNWTPNNISVTSGSTYDSMLDVPTPYADGGNGRGNYCTINPLDAPTNGSFTISDGNLRTESTSSANRNHVCASIGVASGKWYWEITVVSGDRCQAGVALNSSNKNEYVGYYASGWGIYQFDGNKYNNQGGTSGTSYGSAWTTAGDVLMVALDATNSKLWFGKNGTWFASGDPVAGTNAAFTNVTGGELMPAIGDGSGAGVYAAACNFGQRPFSYTPPSGFVALNTQNLPDSTIKKGNQYMDVAIQTGNTTGRTVSGLAFQPDLVLVKNRAGSTNRRWGVIDSVRGVNKTLSTALTDAEVTSQTDLLTAFNSDGFTIGADAGLYGWNGFAESYAHFTWKKGATQGFDIVTYTGSLTTSGTVAINHNLGVAPKLVISKSRNNGGVDSGAWFVWTSVLSTDSYLRLNTTAASASISGGGGGTMIAPTGSVFYTPYISGANINGATYVAYLFAEVAGFSKFGSYTGNGSADGPFVFLGFRPRWVMIKETTPASTSDWILFDTSRKTSNVNDTWLLANSSGAEVVDTVAPTDVIDHLSNGFKVRGADSRVNASSGTYIYAAFAENPFKNALAR